PWRVGARLGRGGSRWGMLRRCANGTGVERGTRTMPGPLRGSSCAVSPPQPAIGFATIAAWAATGTLAASTPATYPSSLIFLFEAKARHVRMAFLLAAARGRLFH